MLDPSTQSIVRDCRPSDCAALAAIYTEHILLGRSCMETRPQTTGDLEKMLIGLSERECILVLEKDRDIVGWSHLKKYSDRPGYRTTCEFSMYISRPHINHGWGRILMSALIDRSRTYGYHHVVLRIQADNEGSIAFCRKFGFEDVGIQREVGVLAGRWRDVAIMQLRFADTPPLSPPAE